MLNALLLHPFYLYVGKCGVVSQIKPFTFVECPKMPNTNDNTKPFGMNA